MAKPYPHFCPGGKWAEEQLVSGGRRQQEAGKGGLTLLSSSGAQAECLNPKLGLEFYHPALCGNWAWTCAGCGI